jgi:hypothetical protein
MSGTLHYNELAYSVYSDNTVAITGCEIDRVDVIIPDEIDGMKVTKIEEFAFYCCNQLKSVTLPGNLITISPLAFVGNYSLQTITVPKTVRLNEKPAWGNPVTILLSGEHPTYEISNGMLVDQETHTLVAYMDYTATSITIPEGIIHIGNYAFYNCTSLPSIDLPDGVTSIGDKAFYMCTSL